MSTLRASTSDLRDLAQGAPPLVEARAGVPTGARLVRCLGLGGMSTVFLAELDPASRSPDLSPLAPRRLAIKFMQADTEKELVKFNMDPLAIFVKEAVALGRVMERKPPTEFVVGFFGSGRAEVSVGGGPSRTLPWLAIEYVDGGSAGTSLTERVRRAHDGVDPVRVLRLAGGMIEGVRVLHAEGIVHRDLKPDNVLIAGPVDDETPKLADCGIARVEGMPGITVAAMTPEYGGPEQSIAIPGQPNPLVGKWTDIHALSAVLWFLIGGEPWCTSNVDKAWHSGVRRSLRGAHRLHAAFVADPKVLHELDDVLARGAAHRLPAAAWEKPEAAKLGAMARARYPSMFAGPERYADVDAFARELLPLLELIAARWTAQSAAENHAATAFRATQLVAEGGAGRGPLARVRESEPRAIDGTAATLGAGAAVRDAEPGNLVFQPDGKVLARFGERLVYFVGREPHKVGVPDALRDTLASTRWVVRGPGGGFALVGPRHVLLVRGGRMAPMPFPARDGGGEVGEIQAAIGDGRLFGVVTAETDDSNGGPELWRSTDGARWSPPRVLPLGGDVHALADGPYGLLVVGSRSGKRARALFVGLDDQSTVYTTGVNDRPPLFACMCGAGRDAWGAGAGHILRFERSAVVAEACERPDASRPAALALDVVGVPWLVTERAVLRRHVVDNEGLWRTYYERGAAAAPLVGIGFTPDGATVLDARGGVVELEPYDIATWRARASERG